MIRYFNNQTLITVNKKRPSSSEYQKAEIKYNEIKKTTKEI